MKSNENISICYVLATPGPPFSGPFPTQRALKNRSTKRPRLFLCFQWIWVPNRPPGEGTRTTFSHLFPPWPPLGSLGGPWVTKTDPRGAKTTPRRSQKGGLGVQKCQNSIPKQRKPCNGKRQNDQSSPWVGHAQKYRSPLPQARWRIGRRQLDIQYIQYIQYMQYT